MAMRRIIRQSLEVSFPVLLRSMLYGIFCLAAAGLVAYGMQSYRQERENLLNDLSRQAKFVADSSQANFDSIGKTLAIISQTIGDSRDLPAYFRSFQSLLEEHAEISALFLFDLEGNALYSTLQRPPASIRLADRPGVYRQFKADLQESDDHYIVSRADSGVATGRWRIPIRYIVRDSYGVPRYVLQASIPVQQQTALWGSLSLLPGTSIGLIRDDRYYQARWPALSPALLYGRPGDGGLVDIVRQHLQSGHFEGLAQLTGTQRIGAYQRLGSLPLTAYVTVPGDLVWHLWRRHNMPLLVVSLCCFLVFSGFAWLLLRREKQHHKALWNQASTDSLTDLPSRAASEDYLGQRILQADLRADAFAVMFLDLDKFKVINDTLGHDRGDLVLQEVARRLKTVIRREDLLARLGGDEFIAVISCRAQQEAQRVAQRMLDVMQPAFDIAGRQFSLTLSIGISLYEAGLTGSRLMRQADLAMYAVKNRTRNGFAFFDETMVEQVNDQLDMQQQLSQALARQEFRLFYQPRYDPAGHIVGVEALLRWQHPARGLVAPGQFIQQAEETGLIVPIGEWVLREAARQLKEWQAAGHHQLRVSVNVSARQFEQPHFTGRVAEILAEADVPFDRMQIEITESMLANDIDGMKRRLQELARLGIAIALDDFGTGYSSLSYLQQFPIHTLKIDRAFVRDITTDPNDAELTNAIIAMGHALKIHVIAEGVETAEQFDYLRQRQCNEFQGYYFSQPVPAAQVTALLPATGMLPV